MTAAPSEQPGSSLPLPSQRLAILVADLYDSVGKMREDEAGTIAAWTRFIEEVRLKTVPSRGGKIVRTLGDSLMLVFDRVPSAAAAALELHARIAQFNVGKPREKWMLLRIGLHVGEVSSGALDIYGAAVDLAARFMQNALPGETWVSGEIRDHLVPGVDADVEDMGDYFLKGVPGGTRVYRLGPAVDNSTIESSAHRLANSLRPGIAVLPFRCLSGLDVHATLGDALADEVISHLARTAELHVISSLSTRSLRGRAITVDEVGGHLGAAYVVSGGYHDRLGRVRLTIELADVRSGHVLWSDVFDTTLQDAFDLDQGLAPRIVKDVSRAVLSREVERATTQPLPTLESYTLLFGAITLMHRASARDFEAARGMLDELAYRHGRMGLAYAWLAKWHVLRVVQGWSHDRDADSIEALNHARRALDSNPSNSLALAMAGLVHGYLRKDLTAAREHYLDALYANPNEPFAWLFNSTWHAYRGEGHEARESCDMALRLSPLDPLRYFFDSLAATALLAGQHWSQSVDLARRSIRANRSHASTWRTLAYGLVMQDDLEGARSAVQHLLAIEPSYSVKAFHARFPGSEGPMAAPWADALRRAGLPD